MSENESFDDWVPSCTLERLRKRGWMLSTVRRFFSDRNVLEVETPCLSQTTGTDVHVSFFSTISNSYGRRKEQRLFLQTSPEFPMKRLLAAGSGSIYQICKAFRNHESGRFHNPEFTILEWYRVGFDLHQLMDEIEVLLFRLFKRSAIQLRPSERIRYRDVFLKYTGIDAMTASKMDFARCAESHGLTLAVNLCRDDISVWLDFLFTHLVQPHLGRDRLTFVSDYPACQPALARIKPNAPELSERMEVFIQGIELANGYNELTEAAEQEQRFRRDLREREQRGLPAAQLDGRFLKSLEFGLPECSGVAMGLDRALMLLSGADHINEVLAFPISRA